MIHISTLIIFIIVVLAFGIPLYIIAVTLLGLGKYGIFGGEKSYFRGIASTKYTSSRIEIKEAKNLNGKLVKTLKVKKNIHYKIKCNIKNNGGDVQMKFSDKNKNFIGGLSESNAGEILYTPQENGKIVVIFEFNKFSGEVVCHL